MLSPPPPPQVEGHRNWIEGTSIGSLVDASHTPRLFSLARTQKRVVAVVLGGGSCCGAAETGLAFLKDAKNADIVVLYTGKPSIIDTVRSAYGLRKDIAVEMVSAQELTSLARPWAPSILVINQSRLVWKQGFQGDLP